MISGENIRDVVHVVLRERSISQTNSSFQKNDEIIVVPALDWKVRNLRQQVLIL